MSKKRKKDEAAAAPPEESVHARAQEQPDCDRILAASIALAKPARYERIAVELIDESTTNPRETFDEQSLVELAASIRKHDIVEPLVVRPKGTRYELVAGARRLRAAKIAGLPDVPCSIRELSDTEALEIQVIENDQRRDVHPLEQMAGYQRLLATPEYGGSRAKLADRIGKSLRFVHGRMELLDATEEVRKAFREGRIKSRHAEIIAREPAAQQGELLRWCLNRNWSSRELQDYVLRVLRRDVAKGGFDPEDPKLLNGVPSCSECTKLSGNCAERHEDAKSKTACTDVECYGKKQQAHLVREVKRAEERGEKLVQIKVGHEWNSELERKWPEMLSEGQYVRIGGKAKKCDLAKPALIVFGEGLGKTVKVCVSKSCKVHKGGVVGSTPADEKRRERERELKRESETLRKVCGRLVDALIEKLSVLPADVSLDADVWMRRRMEDWAEAWWNRLWSEHQRRIRRRHPEWDADTIPIGDLNTGALARLLNEIAFARHLDAQWDYETEKYSVPSGLRESCTFHGIDWQAVEKAVREEAAAPRGKKGKSAKLIDVLQGDVTDTGSVVEYREKSGGPVLARIELTREPKRLIHKHGGASADDLGFFVDISIRFAGFVLSQRVHANESAREEAWASSSVALAGAYHALANLSMFNDLPAAERVLDWADTKRVEFGGPRIDRQWRRLSSDAWSRVARLMGPPPESWPEPNEGGLYRNADCILVDLDIPDSTARVRLVPTPAGWRKSFDIAFKGAASEYNLPSAEGAAHSSASAALVAALDAMGSRLGDCAKVLPSKGRKRVQEVRVAYILLWKQAQAVCQDEQAQIEDVVQSPIADDQRREEGADSTPEREGLNMDSPSETPAERSYVADGTDAPVEEDLGAPDDGPVQCPKCGVWCTPDEIDAHVAECTEVLA